MKTVSDAVVDRICEFIEKQNLTQYALAMRSGLPFPTVKSIMQRRTKNITLKTVILLSKGLGVKPSEFINDDDFLADNIKND